MSTHEPLTEAIPVRFTASDLGAIRLAAEEDERKVSDFIRITVRRALRASGHLASADTNVADLSPEQAFALGQAAAEMGVEAR